MRTDFSHQPPQDKPSSYGAEGQDVVQIGRYSYADGPCHLYHYLFLPKVRIGSFTSVAAGCRFFARQNHHPDWVTTAAIEEVLGVEAGRGLHDDLPDTITIGSDVWIGDSATFLPGITVGDGAVIGANAVIAKDVPPYAIVVGNPARVVRMRFAAVQVEALLRIRWWDWPIERIRALAPLMWSKDIDAFLAAAEPSA